eukprot:TRINITY_DN3860_c0_g1_i1.p1 TRINITY_DN3860_c0_g1~~TRINITY_DN3860_c0_g1_i1.p1  ORF type:complete len:151 (-),score=36.85 TRINITY_DN3860_c0_g1_i1:342-794(-)
MIAPTEKAAMRIVAASARTQLAAKAVAVAISRRFVAAATGAAPKPSEFAQAKEGHVFVMRGGSAEDGRSVRFAKRLLKDDVKAVPMEVPQNRWLPEKDIGAAMPTSTAAMSFANSHAFAGQASMLPLGYHYAPPGGGHTSRTAAASLAQF